jgi:hypothetical protein
MPAAVVLEEYVDAAFVDTLPAAKTYRPLT